MVWLVSPCAAQCNGAFIGRLQFLLASGRAGIATQDIVSGADPRHELADPATRLDVLGDIIPVLMPWRPEVVSVGDVLVAAGLAQLVVVGMTRRRPVSRPQP